jgi:pimeloyl-ACP methyl ester carboxylesterase
VRLEESWGKFHEDDCVDSWADGGDALTPPEIVREISDGIKVARLDLIDNSGHLTALEQPERVNKIMKTWLA